MGAEKTEQPCNPSLACEQALFKKKVDEEPPSPNLRELAVG